MCKLMVGSFSNSKMMHTREIKHMCEYCLNIIREGELADKNLNF